MASEKDLEASCVKAVERVGGLCVKLLGSQFTGLPDRMCLLSGGRIFFIEFKSTGMDLRPRQKYVMKQLMKLGFMYYVIDREDSLNYFIQVHVNGI